MAIDYYVGVNAPSIDVESVKELYQALDLLHTQTMENLGCEPKQAETLAVLETAMESLAELHPDIQLW